MIEYRRELEPVHDTIASTKYMIRGDGLSEYLVAGFNGEEKAGMVCPLHFGLMVNIVVKQEIGVNGATDLAYFCR
jgi:hypothetical protein